MPRPLVLFLVIAGGGLVTGLVAGVLIMGWMSMESVVRSILIGLLYTAVMTITCFAVGDYMRARIPLGSPRAVTYHVLAQTAAVVLSFVAATVLNVWLFSPAFSMQPRTIGIIGLVAFSAALAGNGIVYTMLFFRRAREAERAALEAELSALRAQINPHFLFNALNTIAALTRLHPEAAETVTENLADLFRYSLQTSRQPLVTLRDELASAQLYLSIEQARFDERLEPHFDVPEDLLEIVMPSLVLQPLVENAVKHGVSQVLEPCVVSVTAEKAGENLHIRVTDTGPGFETNNPNEVMHRGTGLANVRERLRLYDRARADLKLLPQGVLIQIPHRTSRDGAAFPDEATAREALKESSSRPISDPHI